MLGLSVMDRNVEGGSSKRNYGSELYRLLLVEANYLFPLCRLFRLVATSDHTVVARSHMTFSGLCRVIVGDVKRDYQDRTLGVPYSKQDNPTRNCRLSTLNAEHYYIVYLNFASSKYFVQFLTRISVRHKQISNYPIIHKLKSQVRPKERLTSEP